LRGEVIPFIIGFSSESAAWRAGATKRAGDCCLSRNGNRTRLLEPL